LLPVKKLANYSKMKICPELKIHPDITVCKPDNDAFYLNWYNI
jgi:hypothetical protein